jgi:hypothetical protein
VYFCHTSHELREAIEKNYCVAITNPNADDKLDDFMLGMVVKLN